MEKYETRKETVWIVEERSEDADLVYYISTLTSLFYVIWQTFCSFSPSVSPFSSFSSFLGRGVRCEVRFRWQRRVQTKWVCHALRSTISDNTRFSVYFLPVWHRGCDFRKYPYPCFASLTFLYVPFLTMPSSHSPHRCLFPVDSTICAFLFPSLFLLPFFSLQPFSPVLSSTPSLSSPLHLLLHHYPHHSPLTW